MPAYATLHARNYDLIYAGKPYDVEAGVVAERLSQCGIGPGACVLDVACGTGRHAVELARLGYLVAGLDLNPALLHRARMNAEEAGVSIEFFMGDMRSWTPPEGRRFDAATCLFDSLGYAGGDEAVLGTLRTIGAALVERGVVVLEVLNAAAMVAHADPVRVSSWLRADGAEVLRIAWTDVEVGTGRFTVDYRLLELAPDGSYLQERDIHSTRAFSNEALRTLLDDVGYEVLSLESAYQSGGEINDAAWHLLATARLR